MYVQVYVDTNDLLDEVSADQLVDMIDGAELTPKQHQRLINALIGEEIEWALTELRRGRRNEAMLHLERALPTLRGLLFNPPT